MNTIPRPRRNALKSPIYRLRRRVDIHALALDAPLPIQPTCKGMGLPWPASNAADKPAPNYSKQN